MTNEDLFRTFLSRLSEDFEGIFALFAPDAVVEFPYATSVGLPSRVEGAPAIRAHFEGVMARIGFTRFRFSNLRSYPCADGQSGWFEVHGTADLPGGKSYAQDYVMYVRSVDGTITHYREYWNMVPIMELAR